MRLSLRMALIVSTAMLAGFGATFAAAGAIIMADHRELEEQRAQAALDGVEVAFLADQQELLGTAAELIQIMNALSIGNGTDGDDSYAALGAALFAANDLDFLAFEATDLLTGERLTMGFNIDRQTGVYHELDELTNASLATSPVMRLQSGVDEQAGIEQLGAAFYLVASKPLLVPQSLDFIPGVIAVGRALDASYFETIHGDTAALADGTDRVERHGRDTLTATRQITTLGGESFAIQVVQDRAIYRDGIQTLWMFIASTMVVAVIIIAVALVMVRRFVTRPIFGLTRRMKAIQDGGQVDERVAYHGDDEVARLADQFDRLMNVIQSNTQELDRFAGVVSHDLQSPLSTFALNLELMELQATDAASLERIARMRRTTEHMAQRIQALLGYARLRDGATETAPVDLDALLAEVVQDLGADLSAASADLRIDPLPTVTGDRNQLAQLFQNLIQNAVKFRKGDAAQIEIQARQRLGRWAIRVRDHGRGFDPEHAKDILKPFHRLSNVGGASGHGVGLAICSQIVERHGGHLRIDGRPDAGAAVTFDLGGA